MPESRNHRTSIEFEDWDTERRDGGGVEVRGVKAKALGRDGEAWRRRGGDDGGHWREGGG